MSTKMKRTVLVTGSAGFIGFHLCREMLELGFEVIGIDALTDYYDVKLKHSRLDILKKFPNYTDILGNIEDNDFCCELSEDFQFDSIIHLAAQAGVRYSIDHPKLYLKTNIEGTFNILELARKNKVRHLLCASTSSVYGSNTNMPFTELQKCDTQMSFYAATKKSNEVMAHSYSHIYGIPITMFRFFTVYGPWGRPDMALFKFTKAILDSQPIDIYNHGVMKRDFTYIDDLVHAIVKLNETPPPSVENRNKILKFDSLSKVAPWRVVNIGNSQPVNLMDYVNALETALNTTAKKNMLEMQPGDVAATWADTQLLHSLTGFKPRTNIVDGVQKFINWYQSYYGLQASEK